VEKEAWVALTIVAIPGVISLYTQMASIRAARNEKRANAGSKDANAAATLTGSAMSFMTKLEKRIEKLEKKVMLQEETIKYLFDGTMVNIEAMEAANIDPPFRPTPTFRGNNGDEFDFEE
jgi:hypothetical protein